MTQSADARSEGLSFTAELDFESGHWSASTDPPESEFPFVAHVNGRRYELYSDSTFAEVDLGSHDEGVAD